MEKTVETLAITNGRMYSRIEKLESDLKSANYKIGYKQDDIDKLEDRNKILQDEVNRLKKEITELKKDK